MMSRVPLRHILAPLLLSSLTACVSSGTKVTADELASFKPGSTTEAEVVQKLGPPNNTVTNADGTKMDMYIHVASSVHASSFIPVVGMFAGGASNSQDSVTFTFDARGILKNYSTSSGHQDVNTGLLNQH